MTANSDDVISIIKRRMSSGRSDGAKVGLAVEGGGMRGIVSGAMVLALNELGAMDTFDAFYGTSSGTMNLAYVLGGTQWEGMAVYYDHLTHDFIRPRPWNRAHPLVDMQYGFDEVMGRRIPIQWDNIRQLDRPLITVLTDVDQIESTLIDFRDITSNPMEYAKAASWMPMVAGPPPILDGTRYLDGVVLCPDPVYAALRDGCTHILLCHSWPQGSAPASPRSRLLLRPVLNRWQSGLGDAYVRSRQRWDSDRKKVRFGQDAQLDGATIFRLVTPAGSHRVQQLTMRRDILLDGARAGYHTVMDAFGIGHSPFFILGSQPSS